VELTQNPVFQELRKPLILRGHLDVVDDGALNGASATFDLEAEAVHQAEDGDDRVFILSEVPADYWFC
jgi:hypothetical protein